MGSNFTFLSKKWRKLNYSKRERGMKMFDRLKVVVNILKERR
jgi:hypothetical protein